MSPPSYFCYSQKRQPTDFMEGGCLGNGGIYPKIARKLNKYCTLPWAGNITLIEDNPSTPRNANGRVHLPVENTLESILLQSVDISVLSLQGHMQDSPRCAHTEYFYTAVSLLNTFVNRGGLPIPEETVQVWAMALPPPSFNVWSFDGTFELDKRCIFSSIKLSLRTFECCLCTLLYKFQLGLLALLLLMSGCYLLVYAS